MRRAVVTAAVAILASTTLSACSGSIAPRTWATSVCQALTPWRTTITTLNQRAQAAMATATTPLQTRTNLLALLAGAEHASETARAAVAAAGVPDVDGGAVIEKRFVTSLAAVRDAYRKAEAAIAALSTDDASAFYNGVEASLAALNTDYNAAGVNENQLASTELQSDFDKVPACR